MSSESRFIKEQKEVPQVDPLFIRSLAEIALHDEAIQTDMKRKGFQQFTPPYTGFVFDTFPPGLTDDQAKQWRENQDLKRKRFFESMSEDEKVRITNQQKSYEVAIDFLIPQVSTSLELLRGNKYGLGEVFSSQSQKQELSSQRMIEIMKSKGIIVHEFPQQNEGFDGKTNHGEARFAGNTWTAKFNKVALSEPLEVLHELIAIECFDLYIQNRPSLREALTSMPIGLIVLSTGKSLRESFARGQYISQGMMTIRILESLFDTISHFGQESQFVQGFTKSIQTEEGK